MRHSCQRFAGIASGALLVTLATLVHACAQSKYETTYGISVARIPLGKFKVSIDLDRSAYTISASGNALGLVGVLSGGEGFSITRGTVTDHLIPRIYRSNSTFEQEKSSVDMALDRGTVETLTALPVSEERVPLRPEHRRGVLDPLTALTFPAGMAAELSATACDHTLSIFDGFQRFDVRLAFKRMDAVRLDEGHARSAVVCSATYVPISGHRASSKLVRYLSSHAMELTLAPIADASFLVPLRLSVESAIANLLVEAKEIETRPDAMDGARAGRSPARAAEDRSAH